MPSANICLTAARSEHATLLLKWRNDPNALQHNPYEILSLEALQGLLEKSSCALSDEKHRTYRWMVGVQGNIVGTVSLHNIAWTHLHAEIGYQIAPDFQNQGIGSAAVALLIELAFSQSCLQRLIALIDTQNHPSINLVKRLGFSYEGTFKKHFLIQGRWVDEAIFALLKPEWCSASAIEGVT